jgi:transcriptional regulator with PAS, ATPase and Fis domain
MNQHQLKLQRDLYRLLLCSDTTGSDIEIVLRKALQLVGKITDARIVFIELRNHSGKTCWSCYHCNEPKTESIETRIESEIIEKAIMSCETVMTQSAFFDSRLSQCDGLRKERIETVLCVPFKVDIMDGAIYLQGDDDSEISDSDCMKEVELFARNVTPLLRRIYNNVDKDFGNKHIDKDFDLCGILGESPILISKLKEAQLIAELDVTVMITGETGTGKGMLANAIHVNSNRKNKPFVHLNCANFPEQLAESELFGAVRGAHSSAHTEIKGKIAAAKGGTLFLDEIGELSIPIQAKLLHFLEKGSYYPLGSSISVSADVRVIAASNINFEAAILNGSFREDLYYRLCVFPIEMPSLKQRKDDIPFLVKQFISKYCARFIIPLLSIDSSVLTALQEYDWNGNVRQLENKIQQGILRAHASKTSTLLITHLFPENRSDIICADVVTYRNGKDDWERRFISMSLKKYEWNISETAKAIGLSRSHLNNMINVHNLERKIIDM